MDSFYFGKQNSVTKRDSGQDKARQADNAPLGNWE